MKVKKEMTCMNDTERVLYFQEGKIMKIVICDDEKGEDMFKMYVQIFKLEG